MSGWSGVDIGFIVLIVFAVAILVTIGYLARDVGYGTPRDRE